jgi:CHAT domain-containing protein
MMFLRNITHRGLLVPAFVIVLFCTKVFSQQSPQQNSPCAAALNSASLTAQYYQRGQTVRAEGQHRITMGILRQLRSLELIRCSFDVQWIFPLEGKSYPAYITEYSTLAFDEAIRTGNREIATQLLAQKAGLLYSKNMFPETMEAFRQFAVFFDPFTAMNVYEREDEIVRKAQLFKDTSRRYTRFMYRTYVVRPPLCQVNDCRHLGWDMQEKIKSRLFRGQMLKANLEQLNESDRETVRKLLYQDYELRLKRNQFYYSKRTFSGQTPYDTSLRFNETQIESIFPQYAELVSNIPPPEEVSKLLAPDEILLSYFYVDKNDRPLYVWKLSRDAPPELKELGVTIEELYIRIANLKAKIEKGVPIDGIRAELSILQKYLIAPFNLPPNHKLIIAVDQNLSSLPFDIMPWGPGSMMLDNFDISYVPSATVFYHLRRRSLSTKSLQPYKLQYAGFAYRGQGKETLDYANIEIKNAGEGFGPAPPNVIKPDATEADLYANGDNILNARYVHLVTHSNPLQGIAGGFYLPFNSGSGEDGQLTSYEIISRLRNRAELVVLSACQTATSNENLPPNAFVRADPENEEGGSYLGSGCICNYGESFSNLSGSFFAAGSRQLLLTQWLIQDEEPTAEFIKRFFDNLRDHKTPAESLRIAKQQMRDDKAERFAPVNWSGFILAGS